MKKLIQEFKEFAFGNNVIGLATAVIMGSAVSGVVNSLVNDIFMPVIGVLFGGINFGALSITLGEAQIKYGAFIQALINFFVILVCVFSVVKFSNTITAKLKRAQAQKEEEKKKEKPSVEDYLAEIRDLLKNKT